MPELPEVEVLVRHLAPLIKGRSIRSVRVNRTKVIEPTTIQSLTRALRSARFLSLSRRGKYLVFQLRTTKTLRPLLLVGHLGMTGRMYLQSADAPLPKHAAVVLNLGRENFVFEDTRYFGRLTLDDRSLAALGPEPLDSPSPPESFVSALKRSSQPIKVKLLDQSLVAGVGNIYASEALHRARISPLKPARDLDPQQIKRLWRCIQRVLAEAIRSGSTLPLNYSGTGGSDGLFYFGSAPGAPDYYEERLRVYDRAGKPCARCRTKILRVVQSARSTFFCPTCQPHSRRKRKSGKNSSATM